MSFSKGVAPMSVHSLLGPSNSESLPEVDLVSTVRMAWLPPQVKYWISNLHRKIKKKKRKKERIVLKNIPPLSSSSSSLLLTVAPRGNFWAARGSYWTGRRDGRGKGWPRSGDSGSSSGSPVVCLSIGRHPRAPGSPPRSLPALPIAAQPCDEKNKNRDRGRGEAKKEETHVCVLIPNVQHPVVKVRGSAARQREHHHAYGPLLGTTAQHRAPRIFQIDFHPGKKITHCYYSRDRGWKDAFRLLGQASGEHSAVQQQYSTWAALVLKLLDRNVYRFEIFVVQRRLNLPSTGIAWWISPSRPKIRIRTNGAGENSILYNILGTISE